MAALKRKGAAERIVMVGEEPLVSELKQIAEASGFEVVTTMRRSKAPRSGGGVVCAFELTNTDEARKQVNLRALDALVPPAAALFSSSVTITAGAQARWVKRPERLIGIGALPTLLQGRLIELAPSIHTAAGAMKHAAAICARLKREISVVQDRVGMVLPRILSALVNEAAFAVMEGVAAPADIDVAMKLGTNYPLGPVEWADRIGVQQVVSVLDALAADTGQERYRAAPLLRQLALEAAWWRT